VTTTAVPDELEQSIQTAVARAIGDATEQQRSARVAAEVEAEAEAGRAWKRAQAIIAGVVAAAGVAVGVVAWIYQQGGLAEAEVSHEAAQDARVEQLTEQFEAHVKAAKVASEAQADALRNIGALQIEQGPTSAKSCSKARPAPCARQTRKSPRPWSRPRGACCEASSSCARMGACR